MPSGQMDGQFAAYLTVKTARLRLEQVEARLLDEYVEAARLVGEPLTHPVTFAGHPAMLLDEPPSRPPKMPS